MSQMPENEIFSYYDCALDCVLEVHSTSKVEKFKFVKASQQNI